MPVKRSKPNQSGRPDPVATKVAKKSGGRPDPEDGTSWGIHRMAVVANPDPRFKYHFANKTGSSDIGYFESIGYSIVRYEEGGPRLAMGQSSYDVNSPIETLGQVLMQIPVELWERRVKAPPQKIADNKETYLKRSPGEFDPLRGSKGKMNQGIPGISQEQEMRTFSHMEQADG